MFRKFVIVLVMIVIGGMAQAQPYHEPTYEQLLNAANETYKTHFYSNAIDLYRQCYRISDNDTLLYKIAELYYLLRDYKPAQRYYKRIFRTTDPEEVSDYSTMFLYARTEKTLGDYNKAYNIYQAFIKLSDNDSLKQLARNDIEGMVSATAYKKRYDLYITSLEEPINSPFSEYAPEEGPDGGLYWTSFDRSTTIKFGKEGEASSDKSSEDDDWYAHITRSHKGKDGKWAEPQKLSEKINRPLVHTTNNSITPDGNYMYLNRQIISGHKAIKSDILISKNNGEGWGSPQKLETLNGEYLALYPTYGELYGEEVVFFASDMPGSMGGLDIYYAPREGEFTYGAPVNLGEAINSLGDERTPYYVNGILYFSSDGHPGQGGLDIFKSTWDGVKWSEPVNLGLGYNSRYDDYYFKTDAEEKNGYLVSNRPNEKMRSLKGETCCDDIYKVGIREIELDVLVTVFSNGKPLLNATAEVVETVDGKITDNSTSLTSPKGNAYRFPLQADKTYRIYVSKDGYTTDSSDLSTMGVIQSYTYKKQFTLERTEPEMTTIYINEPIRLSNIYYNFDEADILPESEPTLNAIYDLMNTYEKMVIELSAHTDSRGSDQYNLELSQERAESAKEYLVNRGIAPDRIIARGYGETKILNGCTNGVECTEEQHRFNRRTEFKIVKGPKTIRVKKEILEGKKKNIKKGKLSIPTQGSHGSILPGSKKKGKPAKLDFHNPFHDFGVVPTDGKYETKFRFTNTGGQKLKIRIATACDCTVLDWPREPISPGESAFISVVFDSSDIIGEREVTIDVIANTVPMISEARFRAFVSQ